MIWLQSPWLFFAVLVTGHLLISSSTATTFLHRGPSKKGAVKLLSGHSLTIPDSTGMKNPRSTAGGARHHVLDFTYHLKKDVLIWDEMKKEGINIRKCRINDSGPRSTLYFEGASIDDSDFKMGVAFSIELSDLEISCRRNLPDYPSIDPTDSYLYFLIRKSERTAGGLLKVVMTITHGMNVVPIVDISVHQEDASPDEVYTLQNNVMYDNDNVDDEVTEEEVESLMSTASRWNALANQNTSYLTLISTKPSLYDETIKVGPFDLKVNVNVNVGVSKFRLRHLLRLQFEWDQSLGGSISARLYFHQDAHDEKKVGQIKRWYIPGISFSIGIPFVGKLSAGAFIGVNWVTQISGSSSMSLDFSANYERKERVTAQLIPPRYDAQKLPGSDPSAILTLSGGTSSSHTLRGFYGIRPLIGAGITHKKTKIRFERRGWRIRIRRRTTTKSIDGNIGADIGIELGTAFQSPAFTAYEGSDLKIGACDKCHSFQGYANFKGKALTAQTVVGSTVKSEKTIVSSLFDIRLGTACLLEAVCPLRRQLNANSE